ncbi:RrF2 family transcriptional regulator [Gehongia tenuis]|uniref:Rrf2 family transcriptional regulator n=1 Tax=Gehongia tenuis TaxID=2763655 RepID=A0A926D489_9FIRM|nr:Rrf2 family transcriptional regulator [Gehongia tenuis]MBC8531271.1 Rrf2 family transcriptional regulator [Gehongia tenuis]
MKLSTKSRYAVEALFYMALNAKEQPVSIADIARATSLSAKYLEQIFLILRRKGILRAVRGSRGGFILAALPEEITVGQIVRAIETHVVPVVCVTDLSQCRSRIRDRCVTRALWIRMAKALNDHMDSITLATLRAAYEGGQNG